MRVPLALSLLALAAAGCATTRAAESDEAPPEVETISSSSVRIERTRKGAPIAHIEKACEVGEVQRVIDLLAASGARRVNLRIDNGAEAEVLTQLPPGKGRWLVVALTDNGFTLFSSTAETLGKKSAAKPAAAEAMDVPLHEGIPDWERLTNLMRIRAAKEKPAGATVAAPAAGPAWKAIEALQQLKTALPDAQRRVLLAF